MDPHEDAAAGQANTAANASGAAGFGGRRRPPQAASGASAAGPDTMGTPQGPEDPIVNPVASGNHHVMTNKNVVSPVRGGPWTPRFQQLAKNAGMSLDDLENQVEVDGHYGPHPEEYHQEVFERLSKAVGGLAKASPEYGAAFRQELRLIRAEVATRGTYLNQLVTK